MKYSIFDSVKAQRGELCTYERFLEASHSPMVNDICAAIAKEPNHDRQGDLKKQLPVITFNALFESQRKNDLALPSGLFMYDGDGIDNPYQFYSEHVCGRKEELGIVYVGMTPSQHGLRIVARCRKEFTTIAECQQWLGEQIGWPCDPACKDWARASYVVPDSYIYYMDGKMFSEEPDVVYEVKVNGLKVKETDATTAITEVNKTSDNEHQTSNIEKTQDTFKGLSLKDIAHEWLKATGGEPEQGERNTRIHALAFEMRYITDFNEETLFAVLPRYGMDDQEMRTLIHSACNAPRSKGIPKQLEKVVQQMRSVEMESDDNEADDDLTLNSKLSTLNSQLPPLPPLIRQVASTAPADFLTAVIICQLPLLGTLGSKLRARYLDGSLHSPSFQVSLEAPQASGKSFMNRLAELELQPIIERDEEERQREQEYNERLAEMKVTGMKVTPENRDELLGQRPKGIIRYVPATISITKLLMRLDNARGLHLCAVAEEIDTVTKAFKRGFSSYGDLLRVAFDNGKYGQDYASDTSFSGIVNARYNTLFSGTPKAMRRFYPDVEDGLVSRVCFVALPDQFGKPMPVWGELKERDRRVVEEQRKRLYEVSIVGDTVQPNHEMQLDFLNANLKLWLQEQQREAVRTDDRTRDIFCRRAAVVGFRAGMLAWFLYGEKNTPTYRRNTVAFARWVATQMLNQHLLRFQIDGTGSNTNRWEDAYNMLGDEFSRDEVRQAITATGSTTPVKKVISLWQLGGCIKSIEVGTATSGNLQAIRFKKVKPTG